MAKKVQTFHIYSEERKREVVRLKLEGAGLICSSTNILELRAQMAKWIKKIQRGESLKDQRGVWNRKHFSSLEKENAYWKVQVEWLKSTSKFTREGIILKSEKFLIMDKLRKKHPFAWLF